MIKEKNETSVKRPRQISFYDQYIEKIKNNWNLSWLLFTILFIILLLSLVYLYVFTPIYLHYKYHSDYNSPYNDDYEFTDPPPYTSSSQTCDSYNYKTVVDLGVSGETSNLNRLVNEIKNAMARKHDKSQILAEGDLEITAECTEYTVTSQSEGSETIPKVETIPKINDPFGEIIKTPKKNEDINTIVNIMKDVNNIQPSDDEARLLRAGPKVESNMEVNQLVYQFNPKKYNAININLPNNGVRMKSNITARQAPSTSTNKNVVVLINEIADYKSPLDFDIKFSGDAFILHAFSRDNNYFGGYSGGPDSNLTIEIIFPPHLDHFNLLSLQHHIGYTHLDKSLENINFNTVAVYTNYGAVVAEHIKAEKFVSTFFNGYLNGYFEVSKNIAVATYYGKIKPIVRFTSNDVHLLAIARYGTVDTHIDKNTFEGTINIQSVDGLPIIYDTDLSSFKSSIMKPSPTLTRLETKYKSLTSDNHLLISGGKNATLTFGELNP
ncbi:unnamed protein product [Cunninghamella blakesleeana]